MKSKLLFGFALVLLFLAVLPLFRASGGSIDWHSRSQSAFDEASETDQQVLVFLYTDWCTYCKTMEKEIFPHPKVAAALENFVLLQADITRQDEDDVALSRHLDMPAPPALYFWNSSGQEMRGHRIIGNVTAEQFASRAQAVQ